MNDADYRKYCLQATHTHELQLQKCTIQWLMHGLLCAYLNLFECLACPKRTGLTATFSISGREVAPNFVRACWFSLLTQTSHGVFLR